MYVSHVSESLTAVRGKCSTHLHLPPPALLRFPLYPVPTGPTKTPRSRFDSGMHAGFWHLNSQFGRCLELSQTWQECFQRHVPVFSFWQLCHHPKTLKALQVLLVPPCDSSALVEVCSWSCGLCESCAGQGRRRETRRLWQTRRRRRKEQQEGRICC